LPQAKSDKFFTDLSIKDEWCKGCGICAAFCPKKALFLGNKGKAEKDQEKCSLCGICTEYCPDFAISLVNKGRLSVNAGNEAGFDAGK